MKRKLALVKSSSATPAKPGAKGLLTDVRELILSARQTVAQGVNSALTRLGGFDLGEKYFLKQVLETTRARFLLPSHFCL